jgi:type IX secretion system PorP/SprF family membrane protein
MARTFTKLITAALCIMSVTAAYAQDIHFSQFYENAIIRNPGLTGIFSGDVKGGINYRTQWNQISVPFTTVLASAEYRKQISEETGDCASFGLTATYDKAGTINFASMQIYGAAAYNKALEDVHGSYLTLGFAGGYIQRTIDISKATFSSQYQSGSYSSSNANGENMSFSNISNFDLGAGISLNSTAGAKHNVNYYIGASAYHILKPKQTFDDKNAYTRLSTRWSGNLGIKTQFTNQFGMVIHANYSNQNPYQELIFGGLVSYKLLDQNLLQFTFYAGTFYRFKDAFIPTVKCDWKTYSVTFSYDVNNSGLKTASNTMGGFEISLYARGVFKKENLTESTKCPRFENLSTLE